MSGEREEVSTAQTAVSIPLMTAAMIVAGLASNAADLSVWSDPREWSRDVAVLGRRYRITVERDPDYEERK